jgi:hypothetical protein
MADGRNLKPLEVVPPTLFIFGVVLISVGILGAGMKAGPIEVPTLATKPTRFAAIALGVGFLAGGAYLGYLASQFTVKKVSVTSDTARIDVCPSNVVYTAVIEVTGGTGSLQYKWVHDGHEEPVATLEFKDQTSRAIEFPLEASDPLGNLGNVLGVPLQPVRVHLQVLTPNQVKSAVITTPKTCELPPEPDVPPPPIQQSGPPAPIQLSSASPSKAP